MVDEVKDKCCIVHTHLIDLLGFQRRLVDTIHFAGTTTVSCSYWLGVE